MIPQMFVRVPKVKKASDLNAARFCEALALQNPLSQPCKERSKVMGSKGEEIIVSVQPIAEHCRGREGPALLPISPHSRHTATTAVSISFQETPAATRSARGPSRSH